MRRQATQRRQARGYPGRGLSTPAWGVLRGFSMPKRTSSTPVPTAPSRAPPARPGRRCGLAGSAHTGQGPARPPKANTPARALRYAPTSNSTPSTLASERQDDRRSREPRSASPKIDVLEPALPSPGDCAPPRDYPTRDLSPDRPSIRPLNGPPGPQGRRLRRRGPTRSDGTAICARPAARDFSAEEADRKWVGDFKQIDTDQSPVLLATAEVLFSRRLPGSPSQTTTPPPGWPRPGSTWPG